MSYADERRIIETRMKNLWIAQDGSPLTPVAYDQKDYSVKDDGKPWVRLTILSGDAAAASVGSPGTNLKRYAGAVSFQINTLVGSGSAVSRALADKLEEIFNYKVVENIRFLNTYSGGSPETNGAWSTWTIWCSFTRDEFNS